MLLTRKYYTVKHVPEARAADDLLEQLTLVLFSDLDRSGGSSDYVGINEIATTFHHSLL